LLPALAGRASDAAGGIGTLLYIAGSLLLSLPLVL
jgi:hypothetical protein